MSKIQKYLSHEKNILKKRKIFLGISRKTFRIQ